MMQALLLPPLAAGITWLLSRRKGNESSKSGRPSRELAILTALCSTALLVNSAAAGERQDVDEKNSPPVFNAWVVDIPSTGLVTRTEGLITFLNKKERKYELLGQGDRVKHDDLISLKPGAVLEVSFEGGARKTFDYRDLPEYQSEFGKWIVFKEQDSN